MPKNRKIHNAEFKAKVAIEAMSGRCTLEEIASKYGVHPVMVSKWKNRLEKNAAGVFEPESKQAKEVKEKDDQIEKLFQTAGQREYELVWFKKKMGLKP